MRWSRVLALTAVTVCPGMMGCGSVAKPADLTPVKVSELLRGSPPPLQALHSASSRLLGGGLPAFRAELRELRGYPVVINKWASWCGPCRSEFPALQVASAKLGARVAFLGLNGSADSLTDARTFLHSFPVSYPSFIDEDEAIARTVQAGGYDPLTVFFDRSGRITFVHAGAYADAASLERDVRRYSLR